MGQTRLEPVKILFLPPPQGLSLHLLIEGEERKFKYFWRLLLFVNALCCPYSLSKALNYT
ncbi:hypothetical protein HanIR_Chr13g0669651 [Helianthus annuus]|nr:hypothetical protein HanIR_Chr13g0669651 [Helianthus annuus]